MANVEDERHVCKECGKSYNKKWRLEEHKRSHTGERPYTCTFEGCGKSFIRPYHLKRHLLIHTGQESFKCSYPGCTQTFSLKHSLKRHEKRSHDNPFKCQYEGCHQSFKKSNLLSKHICETHTKEKRFKCQVEGCDAGFNEPSRLKRHMKKHNKGYICSAPGCSAAFENFSKLTAHIRSHGHVCQQCNRTFSQVWELKRHASIHNTDRKMYECPREGCSRVYTKAFNLRVHIEAVHEGNRPYQCTWEGCGKGFAHKVSLRQHLVLHSQRRIKPSPSPEETLRQKKKKKKRPSLAKQLSGYRSSLSESSDTHCTETAPKKRKTPNQPGRNETNSDMDTREVTPVQTHNGEAWQCGNSASNGVTESTNLTSSSKDSVSITAEQGRSGVMQDVVAIAASSGLETLCNESTTAFTNQQWSKEMQGEVASVASSSVLLQCNNSATTFANQFRPEQSQGGVASASSTTLLSPCSNSAIFFTNQGRPEEMQDGVASASSSTLVTSCNNSATSTECVDREGEMQVEITSTHTSSSSFQEQNAGGFTDNEVFSSYNDGEGMDWEPAVDDILKVHSPLESDRELENEFEDIRNNVGESEDRCMPEDDPSDKGYLSEIPENISSKLPKEIDAEMISTALTAIYDSDSSEDDLPLSLLAKASSLDNKTKVSVKRSPKAKTKEGKGPKKSSYTPPSVEHTVEDSSSRSDDIVPILPPVCLKDFCSNSDIREGVNALESTDFPGMDDVLQVIIEEEENDVDSSECGARLENEDVDVEEGYVKDNHPADASERSEHNAELISSQKQVRRSPRKELNLSVRCEADDNLRRASQSHGEANNNNGALPDEQDDLEMDSFNNVSNDYVTISSDEEDVSVLEQQKPARDTNKPKIRDAGDKRTDNQSCSRGSTVDTCKTVTSRGLTRDQSGSESQVTRDGNGNKEGRTSPDLTSEVNHAEDLRSSVEITNNRDTEERVCGVSLTQSSSKTSRQKNKKNVGAKRSIDKRGSCNPVKPAVPGTAKSRGKNAIRVNRVNGSNSEVNDVRTEADESSQTIDKPVKEETEDVSKAKFRSRSNIFACDVQTLELLWNFKGR